MPTHNDTSRRLQRHLALWLTLLLLCSCATPTTATATVPPPDPTPTPLPGEVELAFESLDQGSGNYDHTAFEKYPAVVLAISPEQMQERVAPLVPSVRVVPAFQGINFSQEFVVAVFQGYFGEGCCHPTVRRVARLGDRILIYAEMSEAAPGRTVPPGSNFPYHVVRVQRDGGPLDPRNMVLVGWKVYTR